MKSFVFANQDIEVENGLIQKNEVGIIEAEIEAEYIVFFVVLSQAVSISKNTVNLFNPKETGDAFDKKVCNVCHRLLNTHQFDLNQNGKNNRPIRRPSCKKCREKIDGVKLNGKEKKQWEKSKPSYEPFQCPICLKTTIPDLTSKIVLDHNHSNGKARGWICDSCNTGIGRFKDDINLLERAIHFLKTN